RGGIAACLTARRWPTRVRRSREECEAVEHHFLLLFPFFSCLSHYLLYCRLPGSVGPGRVRSLGCSLQPPARLHCFGGPCAAASQRRLLGALHLGGVPADASRGSPRGGWCGVFSRPVCVGPPVRR